jgi:tRNA dimethylallyltransferase
MNGKKDVVILVGPTGVGKTAMSSILSEMVTVEIISADSRQIYKYLDIGTAKPSRQLRDQVRHHFVDMLEPDEYYSAGRFGEDARRVIAEIFKRRHLPLVVGGSGLYIKALTEGFFREEVQNFKVRELLVQRLEKEGSLPLYQDLQRVDPESAAKIHVNNGKRIIRALEVYLTTGESLSRQHRKKLPLPDFRVKKFGLLKDRKILYQEIDRRVEEMFRDGLIGEVARILGMGYDKNLNSLNTVGYREVIDYLDGKIDYNTCVEQVKKNSRNYAKRQLTWFRADNDIHWFMLDEDTGIIEVAEEIIKRSGIGLNFKKSSGTVISDNHPSTGQN